jgi:hypothetical protein
LGKYPKFRSELVIHYPDLFPAPAVVTAEPTPESSPEK